MGRYIYGARNGIHIIDLTQTVPLLAWLGVLAWDRRRRRLSEDPRFARFVANAAAVRTGFAPVAE